MKQSPGWTGHFCSFSPFFTKTATNHARIGQFSSSLNPPLWRYTYTAWCYFEYLHYFWREIQKFIRKSGVLTENSLWRQLQYCRLVPAQFFSHYMCVERIYVTSHGDSCSLGWNTKIVNHNRIGRKIDLGQNCCFAVYQASCGRTNGQQGGDFFQIPCF